jgi:hypothetical protein
VCPGVVMVGSVVEGHGSHQEEKKAEYHEDSDTRLIMEALASQDGDEGTGKTAASDDEDSQATTDNGKNGGEATASEIKDGDRQCEQGGLAPWGASAPGACPDLRQAKAPSTNPTCASPPFQYSEAIRKQGGLA